MSYTQTKDPQALDYSSAKLSSTDSPFESMASFLSAQSISLQPMYSHLPIATPTSEEAAPTDTKTFDLPISTNTPLSNVPASEYSAAASLTSYDLHMKPTALPSIVSASSSPTPGATLIETGNDEGWWKDTNDGKHAGVVMAGILSLLFFVALSFWFCCGGRSRYQRHHSRLPSSLPMYAAAHSQAGGALPVGLRDDEVVGADSPPVYAEVAPPQHQSIARGARPDEGGEAVVSDGKMPVSEMVLEDVVVRRMSGHERRVERHRGMGEDTRGHTNT